MHEPFDAYEGHTISIPFEKFEVDEETGEETPDDFVGTHSFVIYSDPARLKDVITVVQGPKLVKDGNELIVTITKTENVLTPGEYFYGLFNDYNSEISYVESQGPLIIHPSRKLPDA
jgi:hypothetical protein